MHLPIALEECQRPFAPLLVLSRFDTIRIQPCFDPHDEPAEFVERESRRSVDQKLLTLRRPRGASGDTTPFQHRDNQRRCLRAERSSLQSLTHEWILRRQPGTEQIRARRRRLAHLDQTGGITCRHTDGRRDQLRRRAKPVLLRQGIGAQVRARFTRDPGGDAYVHSIQPTL